MQRTCLFVAVLALVVAACGTAENSTSSTSTPPTATTVFSTTTAPESVREPARLTPQNWTITTSDYLVRVGPPDPEDLADEQWDVFLTNTGVRGVVVDVDGLIWSTSNRGVYRLDPASGESTLFTIEHGLASNSVLDIDQSSDGSIWVASAGSLSKYAENAWTTYTPVDLDGSISHLEVAPDGTIWFYGHFGVGAFDSEGFRTLGPRSGDGLPVEMFDFEVDDQFVWFSAESGLFRVDRESIKAERVDIPRSPSMEQAFHIAPSATGGFWVGGERVIQYFDGVSWVEEDRPPKAPVEWISWIGEVDGDLWVMGQKDGVGDAIAVARFSNGSWEELPRLEGSIMSEFGSLHVDVEPTGEVWVGHGSGLSRFDGSQWSAAEIPPADLPRWIEAMATADDGAMWVRADGQLFKIQGGVVEYQTDLPGIDSWGSSLAVDADGVVWLGTTQLLSYDGSTWSEYGTEVGLPDNFAFTYVYALPTGEVVAADCGCGNSQLAVLGGGEFDIYGTDDGLTIDNTQIVAAGQQGDLWAVGPRGFANFDGRKWVLYVRESPTEVYSAAVAEDGSLWVGVRGGVTSFDGSSEVTYLSDEFAQANPHVMAIAPDGAVWVAVNDWQARTGEIFRLRDGAWTGIESDRAAFHSVERIVIGQDGVVWIAHREGITRIEPSSQN